MTRMPPRDDPMAFTDNPMSPTSTKSRRPMSKSAPTSKSPSAETVDLPPPPPLLPSLTLITVALILMWLTSLATCSTLALAVVRIPAYASVHDACSGAYTVTLSEKENFQTCVHKQLMTCSQELSAAAQAEFARSDTASSTNDALVESANTKQAHCSAAFTNTRTVLELWSDNFPTTDLTSLPYTPSCTVSQRETITDQIGDLAALRSEAFELSTSYAASSDSTVDRLADYAVLRAAYDASYVANHTASILQPFDEWASTIQAPLKFSLNATILSLVADVDHLMSCVTPRNQSTSPCPYGKSAHELLDEVRHELESSRAAARDRVGSFVDKTAQYKENVGEAFMNAKAFYEGVTDVVSRTNINTGDWGDWYNIGLIDLYPSPVVFPAGIGNYPSFQSMDEIWGAVSANLDAFNANLTAVAVAANRLSNEWRDGVTSQLDQIPSPLPADYNPPQYVGDDGTVTDVEGEKARHGDKSSAFVTKSAVALDAFDQLSQYEEEALAPPNVTFNFTGFINKASEIDVTFEAMRGPGFDITLWAVSFGHLASLVFALDYAFRGYQTARMIYYYWARGAVEIPDVDLTVDQESGNPFKMSSPRLLGLILSSSLMPVFLGVLFTVVGGLVLSGVYEPLYAEYQNGCIGSVSNGTFLTQNLFSVAYNFASHDGNEATFAGIKEYDLRRAEVCAEYGGDSGEALRKDSVVLESLKQAQGRSVAAMELYKVCVDVGVLDPLVKSACESEGGYACPMNELVTPSVKFDVPGNYIMEAACETAMDDWVLEDAVYDCDALPTCDLKCGGPDREVLEAATEECGCMVEWGAHSIWIHWLLSFVIYVLVNLSRMALVKGVAKVLWDRLHSGLFTFKGTAKRDGELVVGKKKKKKKKGGGDRLGCLIKRGLDEVLRKYKLKGVAQVLLALGFNVPWIWAMMSLSKWDNIAYRGGEE